MASGARGFWLKGSPPHLLPLLFFQLSRPIRVEALGVVLTSSVLLDSSTLMPLSLPASDGRLSEASCRKLVLIQTQRAERHAVGEAFVAAFAMFCGSRSGFIVSSLSAAMLIRPKNRMAWKRPPPDRSQRAITPIGYASYKSTYG